MAFESLTDKLQNVFKKLRSKGRLTEEDVKLALKEVKMALLEADVNFKVVKQFTKSVQEQAIGQDVMSGLNPGQMVIKIVNDELVKLMGSETTDLPLRPGNEITVFMMAGLQGAGKTTTVAKLAGKLKSKGKKPLLVACDVYRPAAIEQLKVVGKQLNIPVFDEGQGDPVEIAKHGIDFARKNGYDLVFLDTAGRLHIDEKLMDELKNIKATVKPTEIILVVDAMTGQDAVTVAQTFDEALGIDGVLMSKMDGDARGGAALSVKAVTGKPIKFIGTGEKLGDIEPFHPDRMASRILGMGDVLTLIEKAQESFDQKQAAETAKKMMAGKLTLTDFYDQLQKMKNMGSMEEMLGMLPGVDAKALAGAKIDEKQMAHTEAIIQSMTPKERDNPSIINYSRKKRIANGCGLSVEQVNKLLKQFEAMQKMTKQLTSMARSKGKKRRGFPGLGNFKLPF